jgi:hypothetical protein
MARHRAVSSRNQEPSIGEDQPERRSSLLRLDADPLWTGLLLTVAEGMNRSWLTALAWSIVGVRSATAVWLPRFLDWRYRDREDRSSGRPSRRRGR